MRLGGRGLKFGFHKRLPTRLPLVGKAVWGESSGLGATICHPEGGWGHPPPLFKRRAAQPQRCVCPIKKATCFCQSDQIKLNLMISFIEADPAPRDHLKFTHCLRDPPLPLPLLGSASSELHEGWSQATTGLSGSGMPTSEPGIDVLN